MERVVNAGFSSDAYNTAEGRGTIWCNLEQEYKEEDADTRADFSTLYGMLSNSMAGLSAVGMQYANCKYVRAAGGTVIITLDFYVWPSSLDLSYTLSSNQGDISNPRSVTKHRAFDMVIDGQAYSEMDFVFQGNFSKKMPVFDTAGREILQPQYEIQDSLVLFDYPVHTVMRGNGQAKGYEHTITASFTKEGAAGRNRIEDVNLIVSCTWTNENGEFETKELRLDIPDCATRMLEWCEGTGFSVGETHCKGGECTEDEVLVVYYNVCNGKVIAEQLEKDE